jgi:hypothetical protein
MKRKFILLLGLSGLATPARAEDPLPVSDPLPPGVFTSTQQSDDWKIQNALSAAPAVIAEEATVMDWPTDLKAANFHGRILRQGSNGWTCMPDAPGKPQHDPACMDETMMKWITAAIARKKPNIDRIGLSYMLLGEVGADIGDISAAKPPVMLVLPDSAAAALRDINQDPSTNGPYVRVLRYKNSTPLLVLPVAKAGERVVVQPSKSPR